MDDEQEAPPPPKLPKLYHIFCNNVNTKVGTSILQKIGYPYEKNLEDYNAIIGNSIFKNLISILKKSYLIRSIYIKYRNEI